MPEERNRIEVDRIAQLLFTPDERSREQLASEGVPGRAEVVGDVMADATRLLRADRTSSASTRSSIEPLRRADASTARRTPSPSGCGSWSRASTSTGRSFVFPVHPRTRKVLDEHGIEPAPQLHPIPPVGYLEMLALVAGARAVVTDSGGLQKEAYWLARSLRHAAAFDRVGRHRPGRRQHPGRPGRRGAARRRCSRRHRSPTTRPSSTATAGRPRGSLKRSIRFARMSTIAIVGAGYVGVPLAHVFAGAGHTVVLVDVQADRVEQLNRGESYIEDVPSEAAEEAHRRRPAERDHRLRRAEGRRRDPGRAADAALRRSASPT